MRSRLFIIIQRAQNGDIFSKFYDLFIMTIAVISLVPLMFKENNVLIQFVDRATVSVLLLDYLLRWITYDYKVRNKSRVVFIKYPFMPIAIIDLLAILPSLGFLGPNFMFLRLFRIFKVFRYSKHLLYIYNVFKKERKALYSILVITVGYIFISALIMFQNEPETFDDFFEALYWSTTALTTIGYGDIYPITIMGRLVSMVSSLFGIAIIALPAGIVTVGFIEEINIEHRIEKKAGGPEMRKR